MFQTEAARKQRSKFLYVVAAVAVACHVGDLVLLGGPSLPALAVRLAWGFCLALLALAAPHVRPAHFERVVTAAGLSSVGAWVALTVLTGGSPSPYFDWMSTLPLIVGALGPGYVWAVAAVGLATIVANALLLVVEGAALPSHLSWLSFSIAVGGLAVAGSKMQQRLRAAEQRAEEARLRAVDDLAVSEHRRLHAEKLALLGKLSSGVAHEINNPLAFVKSNLAHLLEQHGGGAGCAELALLREIVEDSQVGIERIEGIIDTLRSFARVDDAGLQPCSLAEVVDEALRLASAPLRPVAEVRRSGTDSLPRVMANRGQLVQVLVNLLVNAADAIAETKAGRGVVRLEAWRTDGLVVLDVIDSGPGLEPAVQQRLFEPFFTTKPPGKGTGLGLALSREYLKRFDATLEAQNEPGGGARFRLRLVPATAAQRSA
ncbi:sensor histidine kinase [Vulgatibacter sp.]|uniref:sensor histidine kinase n=1 Tax=Vulgatibacter sp. TaxID=1971226 RepID=UPI00356A42EE